MSSETERRRLTRRFRDLNKSYLRAYRKKVEEEKSEEDVIQTARFNLKLENAMLPKGRRGRPLTLIDLINADTSQVKD